jgi:maltokinase
VIGPLDQVELASLAATYLARQSWYLATIDGESPAALELTSFELLAPPRPGLAQLLLTGGGHTYQLIVGWRSPPEAASFLHGRESALLGPWEDEGGPVLVYDALADDELAIALLAHVTEGRQQATRVRRVSSLVSHASLVFDEALFMKCYRVLEQGWRPEVEVMLRLDELGFNALLAPVAHWRRHGFDLALVREFLPSALEGRLLALTSLRDLLAHASDRDNGHPDALGADELDADRECATAGGDLASEMRRLGTTTARLHVALAAAFGEEDLAPSSIAAALAEPPDGADARHGEAAPGTGGRQIRLHGDYHLRRVMRSEAGWLVAGFSDDPLFSRAGRGPSLGRRGSPVEDLADLCFSLGHAASEALDQRPEAETEVARRLAAAWVRRNRRAFLDGYLEVEDVRRLLPVDPALTDELLAAFEGLRTRRYEATSAFE